MGAGVWWVMLLLTWQKGSQTPFADVLTLSQWSPWFPSMFLVSSSTAFGKPLYISCNI